MLNASLPPSERSLGYASHVVRLGNLYCLQSVRGMLLGIVPWNGQFRVRWLDGQKLQAENSIVRVLADSILDDAINPHESNLAFAAIIYTSGKELVTDVADLGPALYHGLQLSAESEHWTDCTSPHLQWAGKAVVIHRLCANDLHGAILLAQTLGAVAVVIPKPLSLRHGLSQDIAAEGVDDVLVPVVLVSESTAELLQNAPGLDMAFLYKDLLEEANVAQSKITYNSASIQNLDIVFSNWQKPSRLLYRSSFRYPLDLALTSRTQCSTICQA
ncbi:hypothetical protein HDU91_000679 [Kappamyces sp. JEL0680]|nr:hypothetical protein HDU91_000679 [Kappamyces sp. JEL0680]